MIDATLTREAWAIWDTVLEHVLDNQEYATREDARIDLRSLKKFYREPTRFRVVKVRIHVEVVQ